MPWKKGQSGNPGGRGKRKLHIREIAENYAEEAINKIVDVMRTTQDEKIRIQAATYVLDRAYGKPAQEVIQSGSLAINQTIDKPQEISRDEWIKQHSPKAPLSLIARQAEQSVAN